MRPQTHLTTEHILEIIDLYEKGHNILEICTVYKTGKKRISEILKTNGVEIRPNASARKYPLDENYFETINSPEKAQLLGMFFADGCIANKNTCVQIQLSEKDKAYLEHIQKEFKTQKPLIYKKSSEFISPSNGKIYTRQPSYTLTLRSRKLVDDAYDLNLIPRKSFNPIQFPNISDNYINSFILGFFEGDGYISHKKIHRCSVFGILCQACLAEFFKSAFKKHINVDLTIRPYPNHTSVPLCYIETQSKKDIIEIYKWLYRDVSFHLIRKKAAFESIINAGYFQHLNPINNYTFNVKR